jgi:hypothetical protein
MKSISHNINLQISQTMKTRSALVALVMVAMSTFVFGCSPTVAASSDIRTLDQKFYGIILNGNANVYLTQGDISTVRVEGIDELAEQVGTSISNGALIINAGSLRNVNVYVTMSDVNLLQVNGSGIIRATSTINSDMLLMKISGTGTISADVRALSLGMIINGGGKIYAGGITGDSFVKVKGSGEVVSMNLDSLKQTASLESMHGEQTSVTRRKSHHALTLHQ